MPPVPDDLPDTDKALVAAVRSGEPWPSDPKRPTPDELADPEYVKGMPAIRGTTIRALCIGLWDDIPLHPQASACVSTETWFCPSLPSARR